MDMYLGGKVAVVTGASKGIGLAICRSLAAEGVKVVAASRSGSEGLTELASTSSVHPVLVDLTSHDGPVRVVSEAVRMFGALDVLVNNVGALRPRLNGCVALSDDDWDWAFAVNFLPAVRAVKAAMPHLLQSAPSSIVTISSINAFLPNPSTVDYSAAKGALANFCKSLSREFGRQGVRVNTISPGPVETTLWLGPDGFASKVAGESENEAAVVAKQAAAAATGRFTLPSEVADLVVILASNRFGNITGSDIVIDGGLVTTL